MVSMRNKKRNLAIISKKSLLSRALINIQLVHPADLSSVHDRSKQYIPASHHNKLIDITELLLIFE